MKFLYCYKIKHILCTSNKLIAIGAPSKTTRYFEPVATVTVSDLATLMVADYVSLLYLKRMLTSILTQLSLLGTPIEYTESLNTSILSILK